MALLSKKTGLGLVFWGLAPSTLYEKRRIEPEEACQQASNQHGYPQVVHRCQGGLRAHTDIRFNLRGRQAPAQQPYNAEYTMGSW